MKTKKRKSNRRRRPTPVNVGGTPPLIATEKPFRPPKRVPTQIETTAMHVNNLTNEIQMIRRRIGHIESDLQSERASLASLMLEHSEAVNKIRELAQIPQPVA